MAPFVAGYYADQSGIIKRYLMEHDGWKGHLNQSRYFIKQSALFIGKKEKVAVLGSGWWLDLPIDFLTNRFKQVHLFDIRHPKQIVHQSAKYKNIYLHRVDITGGFIFKAFQAKSWSSFVNREQLPGEKLALEGFDFVVSLNIMNQLDILLIDFLKKRFGNYSDEQIIREKLQQEHIQILPENKTCLITDYKEVRLGKNGNPLDEKKLIYTTLPLPQLEKTWKWNFDTHQTYNRQNNTQFNVKGLFF